MRLSSPIALHSTYSPSASNLGLVFLSAATEEAEEARGKRAANFWIVLSTVANGEKATKFQQRLPDGGRVSRQVVTTSSHLTGSKVSRRREAWTASMRGCRRDETTRRAATMERTRPSPSPWLPVPSSSFSSTPGRCWWTFVLFARRDAGGGVYILNKQGKITSCVDFYSRDDIIFT